MTDIPAEVRATAVAAVAKALTGAANDFGEGTQIAGDVWKLAGAAYDAAARLIRAAERGRFAEQITGLHLALEKATDIIASRDAEIEQLRNQMAAREVGP